MIIKILIVVILIYVLGFLVVPNHVFYTKIKRSDKLRKIALKLKSSNKEKTLRNVYDFVRNNFSNEKYNFILQFYKLFFSDVEDLLEKKQFAQCTLQNLVLITLLVNTGQFKESDTGQKINHIYRIWTIVMRLFFHPVSPNPKHKYEGFGDFKRKWKIIHLVVLHQYVVVKIKNKLFRVDTLLNILREK